MKNIGQRFILYVLSISCLTCNSSRRRSLSTSHQYEEQRVTMTVVRGIKPMKDFAARFAGFSTVIAEDDSGVQHKIPVYSWQDLKVGDRITLQPVFTPIVMYDKAQDLD